MKIMSANYEDLPKILELQKIAYLSEAEIVNNKNIQPLTQTLEELEQEFKRGVVLKAVDKESEQIVGSVRGYSMDNTLFIGKLMVRPSHQNRGIGKKLLLSIEGRYPNHRYELFTNEKIQKNISFYERNGYNEYNRIKEDDLVMIYLQK